MKKEVLVNWDERLKARNKLKEEGFISSSFITAGHEKLYQLGIDRNKIPPLTKLKDIFDKDTKFTVAQLKDRSGVIRYYYEIAGLQKLYPLDKK